MNFPANLKYSKDHEWIRIEGSTGFIGITEHAQSELGDIAYVDISENTTEVKFGEIFGTIEAVKAVSDLISPATGKVLEINTALNDDPSVVNSDPYGNGWMIKIEITNPTELEQLMDAAAYKAMLG